MLSLKLIITLTAFASSDHAPKVSGWEALSLLQTGNMRFFEGRMQHPNLSVARRELVAGGQHPHSILVSCSDSRAPVEQLFDSGLGDIFTVRNAGNVMTTEAIASVEYAIEHLGARLLVVMGHESCGAVGAAVASVPGKSNGSPSLDVLVKRIRGNLSTEAVNAAAADKTFRHGVKENVAAALNDLVMKSAIVREAVTKKGLVLGQAIYSLKSGRVEFWDVGKTASLSLQGDEKTVVHEGEVKEEVIASDVMKPHKEEKPAAAHKAAPKPPKKKEAAHKPAATPVVDAHHDHHDHGASKHDDHGAGKHDDHGAGKHDDHGHTH
jgi:carbonic anhydrase